MRNAGLDCMRGVAIALVVCNHIGIRIPLTHTDLGTRLPRWLLNAIQYNGGEGVTIFFVLSGFLITTRARERYGTLGAIPIRAFLLHRAARILPCLLALLGIIGLLGLSGAPDYSFTKPNQNFTGAALAALGLYFNVWQADHGWSVAGLTVLWSLSIEELFYLGFPFLCRLPIRALVFLLVLLACFGPIYQSTLHGNEIWVEQATFTGLATIAAGALASIVASRFRMRHSLCFCLGMCGLALMASELFATHRLWQSLGQMLLASLILGTVLLALALYWAPPSPRLITWPLRRLGQLSYEIYLSHMFVVMTLVHAFHAHDMAIASGWLIYPVAFALIWLLGESVSRLLSHPAARFFDNAARRMLQKPNIWSSENPPAPLSSP